MRLVKHRPAPGAAPFLVTPRRANRSALPLLSALIMCVSAMVAVTHWPALSARSISFDDREYLTQNPLVQNPSWASTKRFLTEVLHPSTVGGYYQPLAMISLMLDSAMGGRPDHLRPYHRTSLALHVANTAMVVLLLYMLFGEPWAAVVVGLLFGVHPLTVEPIPGVGERKTLLAAFFSLLALIAYVREAKAIAQGERAAWYGACLVGYVLAVLSKPTAMPLPVLLVLLDYWPLDRLSWRSLRAKTPFFAIAAAASVITFLSQQSAGEGAVYYPSERSPLRIPLILCHNIVFYLYKMVWPANLSSHYPFPEPMGLSQPMVLAGVIGTATLLPLLLLSLRRTRALLTGWLIFFVAILPTMGVIGFTNVIAADKYFYLPALGFLMILAWLLGRLWSGGVSPAWRVTIRAMICGGVLFAAVAEARATRRYVEVWQDTERLFLHMLRAAPQAWRVHTNLGIALAEEGRVDEAIAYLRRALDLNANQPDVPYNLALALTQAGRLDEAAAYHLRALELDPHHARARRHLAGILLQRGRFDEAIDQFRRLVDMAPEDVNALYNLGSLLAQQGKTDEAIAHLGRAVKLQPDNVEALNNLGNALDERGRIDEAITHYRRALQYKPDSPATHTNLALALARRGRTREAEEHFRRAIQLKPGDAEAHVDLADFLRQTARPDEAAGEYREALRIDPQHAIARERLTSTATHPEAASQPER